MIQTIGIIGAGQMGNGIAHVLAVAGYDILLTDTSNSQMQKALRAIGNNLSRQVSRGHLEQVDATDALARIQTVAGLPELAHAELVVEAATEDEDIKRGILSDLGKVLNPDALICTNTSSISITRLASVSGRPEKFMGMHFMNPVPIMKLVEVIRGHETSDETTASVMQCSRALGKTPVEANDYPGFVANRVLMPMINEAIFCLMEGVADREGIDTVMQLGMAHPMGPLTLADLIGLDVCLFILEVLHEGLGDDKYRPCPLLRRMVAAGHLGRKSGRGFYEYE